MKTQQDKIKSADLTKKFNGELENYLVRIENVLNYYNDKENQDRLKKELGNTEYVSNFCNFYFKLRGILQEKYGFDYVNYEPKWKTDESGKMRKILCLPYNKTGINVVDPELLEKDSKLYGMVIDMMKKIRSQN